MPKNDNSNLKEHQRIVREIREVYNDIKLSLDDIWKLQDKITKAEIDKQGKVGRELKEIEGKINGLRKEIEQKGSIVAQALELPEDAVTQNIDLINKYSIALKENEKEIKKIEKSIADYKALNKDTQDKEIELLTKSSLLTANFLNFKKDLIENIKELNGLDKQNNELTEEQRKSLGELNKEIEAYNDQLRNIISFQEDLEKKIELINKIQDQTIALTGLRKNYQSWTGIIQSLTQTTISWGEAVKSVSKTVNAQSITFNLLNRALSQTKDLIFEYDNASVSFNKATGNVYGFKGAIEEVYVANREYAVSLNDVSSAMADLYANFDNYVFLSQNLQKQIADISVKFNKAFNIAYGTTTEIFEVLTGKLGITTKETINLYNTMIEKGREAGIPPKKMAENFARMIGQFVIYGREAVKVYEKMAIMAKNLNVQTDELFNFDKRMKNFEDASRTSAILAQYVGKQIVQPFELFNAKGSEAVKIIANRLRENFAWEKMTIQERIGLANQLGISEQMLASLINNTAEQERKKITQREKLNKLLDDSITFIEMLKSGWRSLAPVIRPFLEILRSVLFIFDKLMNMPYNLGGIMIWTGLAYKILPVLKISALETATAFGKMKTALGVGMFIGFLQYLNYIFTNWDKFSIMGRVLHTIGLAVLGLATAMTVFGASLGGKIGAFLSIASLLIFFIKSLVDNGDKMTRVKIVLYSIGSILTAISLIKISNNFNSLSQAFSLLAQNGNRLVTSLGNVFNILSVGITNLATVFVGKIALMQSTSQNLLSIVTGIFSKMGKVIISVASSIFNILIPAIQFLMVTLYELTIALITNPITWIVLSVVAVIGILIFTIYELVKHWDIVVDVLKAGWNFIVDIVKWAIDIVVDFLMMFGKIVFDTFKFIGKIIIGTIKFIWDIGKALIIGIFKLIKGVINLSLTQIWDSITGIFKGIFNAFTDYFEGLWDSFYEWGISLVKALKEGIWSVVGTLTKPFKWAFKKIKDLLPFSPPKDKSSPFADIMEWGGNITHVIGKGVEDTASNIVLPIQSVLNQTRNIVTNANTEILKTTVGTSSTVNTLSNNSSSNVQVEKLNNTVKENKEVVNKLNSTSETNNKAVNMASNSVSNINNTNILAQSRNANGVAQQPIKIILKLDERVLGSVMMDSLTDAIKNIV